MLPRWAQYSLYMLHSSMQQGRTVCKRQSNVSSQGPLPARQGSACAGKSTQLTAHLSGEGSLPPSLTLDRETCFNGMAVITDTRPPTARKWICATTPRRTACYLLVPEALCTHGLHASHLWSRVPYLVYPSIAKAVSLPRGYKP